MGSLRCRAIWFDELSGFWLYIATNVVKSVGRGFQSRDSLVNAVIERILTSEEWDTREVCEAENSEFGQIISNDNAMLDFWLPYIASIEESSQPEHLIS